MAAPIWEDGARTPLPPLDDTTRADVCIIGLGGAGLSAAHEMTAHGASVVGIDAGPIGGGAAGRNAGFLLSGLADFFHVLVERCGGEVAAGLYRCTLDEIARLAAEFPRDVTRTGSLRIAASPEEEADCHAHRDALQKYGFAAEDYAGREGMGVLVATDGIYRPLRCVREEAAWCLAAGARLFEHSPAVEIATGRVRTPAGEVRCDTVLVTVDGGLETLLPELRGRVRTARLQMVATAPARDVAFPRPVYWRYGYEYWQQLATGEIALGGFRDRGGEGEWTTEPVAGGRVQELLEEFLRKHLKTTAPITHRWAACVAYTQDRLPVVEPVRERVWAVGAYSGTGNVVSRLCGRAAARLASGKDSAWATLLSSAREAGRQAGHFTAWRKS